MIQFRFAAFLRVFVLAAFLVTAIHSSASAANSERLEIVNHTGYNIKAYYLVQAGYEGWGSERLGSQSFDNGQTRLFYYDPQFRYFKLKIVFDNRAERAWANDAKLDFKNVHKITIYNTGRRENNGKGRMIFAVNMN